MKRKFKIKKIASLLMATIFFTVPLASCSTHNNFVFDNTIVLPNDVEDVNGSTQNDKDPSYLDEKVYQAYNGVDPLVYETKSSNSLGLKENYLNFSNNTDFNSYLGDSTVIEKDIYLYFYNLFNNNTNVSLLNANVEKVEFENVDDNKKMTFNSKISLTASIDVRAIDDTTFVIYDKQIEMLKGDIKKLSIKIDQQAILPSLSNFINKYYLGWKVNKATFIFDKQTFDVQNFEPCHNLFSYVFKVSFNNLSSTDTYFDLKQKHASNMYNNISDSDLNNKIKEKIDSDVENYLNYFNISSSILNVLKNDYSINVMLQKIILPVYDLLVAAKIFPEYLRDFFQQTIYGDNTNGEISGKPFINAFYDNKNAFKQLISLLLGDLVTIVEPYIDMFKPGITQDSDDYKKIDSLLNSLPQEVKTLIYGDVLGITSAPKSLFDILFDNYAVIFNLIGSQNQTLNSVKELLDLLLTKNNDKFVSLYDVVFKDQTSKETFMNIIKKIITLPAELENIINIVFVNNNNLNKTNLMAAFASIYNFINSLFAENENYTSIEDKYKNLSITLGYSSENKVPKIDKENNTISFEYLYNIKIKTPVKFDLKAIKNLIDKKTFMELIKKLGESNGIQIPSIVSSTDLDKLVLKYIPDYITLGGNSVNRASSNTFTIKAKAENEPIYFEPQKNEENKFENGFTFHYNMNIKYSDQNMIDEITQTNGYKKDGNLNEILINVLITKYKMDLYYSSFWKSIIDNIFARDYDIVKQQSISTGEIIANNETYNENQFYSQYSFKNNLATLDKKALAALVPNTDDTNFESILTTEPYKWSDQDSLDFLTGKKPILKEGIKQEVANKIFDLSNFSNNEYYLKLVPIFNMSLPLKMHVQKGYGVSPIDIDLKIETFLMDALLYFPFKVYDSTNKTMTNYVYSSISNVNFSK